MCEIKRTPLGPYGSRHLPLTFENRSPISNIQAGGVEEYPIREQQIELEKHLLGLMSEVYPDRSLGNIRSGHITQNY